MKKGPILPVAFAVLALPAAANVVHFPGLWQSQFKAPSDYGFAVAGSASQNTAPVLASNLVAVADAEHLDRTPGVFMDTSAGEGPSPKQNPISGRTWGWYNYDVYAYEGEMFVEEGKTYQFYGRFDDGEALVVDGRTVVHQGNNSGYNYAPVIATSYTATATGWVPFNAWIWDWEGGKNVMYCRFALQYNPSGTPSTSYEDANVWKELADPGDMTLFRVAGSAAFTTIDSIDVAQNGTDFELGVSFAGLPSAATVYACYGALDGGTASTSAWDHVVQIGTAAAGTSTETWTLPGAVGAKAIRLYVEGAAGVATYFTEWTDVATLTADPIVALGGLVPGAAGVTASADLLALGVGAPSDDLLLEVAASADGFDAPAFTFACPSNPATATGTYTIVATGLATNTTYWFRAKATNELGGAAVSSVSSLALRPTAPAGSYAFAGAVGSTLSGTATVSSFGDDATWAKVRLEAATDAAFRSIAAASPEVSAEIGVPIALAVAGLDYATEYFVRLRIVNDWGFETFVVDDELRATGDAPFSPLKVYAPGLVQARLSGAMDRTTDILSHSTATNAPGAIMASTSGSAVNAFTGQTHSWGNNTTFGYVGQMWMTGGTTYWFGKYIDDSGDVTVDGTKVMQNDTYNAFATASFTPEITGWHDIEFRFGNGTGGAGANSGTIGFGFNTNGVSSFTVDTFKDGGPWSKAVDPGDCSLLRCVYSETPFFSVESIVPSGGDLVATVSFAGLPEGVAELTAFHGAGNGGFDPALWTSSALVTNPPAGDTAAAQYVITNAADTAFVAFRLTGTAGTNGVAIPYVQWGESYNLAQESPVFGISVADVAYTNATFIASCTGMGAGADSVTAAIQISTTRDFADIFLTVPLSLAGIGSQTLSVNGFTTNTAYFARVVGENNAHKEGTSAVASFVTLDPQPPEGVSSFSGRGFTTLSATALVTTFGTGSASAMVRFEASTNGFATIAATSAGVAATAGTGALLAVPGLAPDTAYALRLRIENEWGLVTYVPIDGTFSTREAPLSATGIGYTFAADRTTVDFTFGVSEVFDGATCTATLTYAGEEVGSQNFTGPGTLSWAAVPAVKGAATATVRVVSVVNGVEYSQSWSVSADPRTVSYTVPSLAALANLALYAGDTVTLPELPGTDDHYFVMDVRSFELADDGVTLVALEPGFSAVLAMVWNASAGDFAAAGRGFAVCIPETEGSGRVFLARPGSGSVNWTDTTKWRNLTNPGAAADYPHFANDVAMAALPADGQLILNNDATVAELYLGPDENSLHKAVRLTGQDSSTLIFRRGSGKPGLFRFTGHGRLGTSALTGGWSELHVGGGSGNSPSTGLGIEMPGGLVFDGGAWPDFTAWDSDEMKSFGRARCIMGDNMRYWNVPEGKTLRIVNTYSRYKMTGDDQGGNANFVWNNGGQVTGKGTWLYDGAASTYMDDPFYEFEGTVAVRNKQKYDDFAFGSRGGSFWMVNWTQPTRTAPNATLLVEGDVAYSGLGGSYGVVSYGNAHGYGSWGWTDNALPGKAWILNGGYYRAAAMNNNAASWRADGTTATQPVCVPNGAETLVVSNGFSSISLGQNGDVDRPTNSVAFAHLEHAGDGTLRVGSDRTYNSYQNNGAGAYWRVRMVLGGFHDHAIGGTGHAVCRHGDASVRTNLLEATAPIVPWIVTDVQYATSLYFPGADDDTDEIVIAGHPKATVLDETTDPKANVRVSATSLALSADRTVNSLVVQNNYNKTRNLGAGRKLTITSGGLIVGDGNQNNTGIGDKSGFEAGTTGTIYFPRKAYIYCPTQNDTENNHPAIWAPIVSPKGAVFSFPGDLHLFGDQTGIDDHIAVNGADLRLGNATTGCDIDVPVHLHGAFSRLTLGKQGTFCHQDLHFWDHGTPGSKFVPVPGTTEVVHRLYVDGTCLRRGIYGSSESGAENVDDAHFSGTGLVKVISDENFTLLFLR